MPSRRYRPDFFDAELPTQPERKPIVSKQRAIRFNANALPFKKVLQRFPVHRGVLIGMKPPDGIIRPSFPQNATKKVVIHAPEIGSVVAIGSLVSAIFNVPHQDINAKLTGGCLVYSERAEFLSSETFSGSAETAPFEFLNVRFVQ